eukprot:TRINITY_DN3090_c0_g1_i1.p2 TRINITY_DN3090_c0_g1~~TRINITY_DN3090_c0_g1_i1.p2  ORF type:complete len:84 (-),score=10.92 TRINITY_DN3090_c0_g1_i1:53-304(-)
MCGTTPRPLASGSEGAQTTLQQEYHKSMTLVEAEGLAVKILKQVMEEKLNSTNIEIASVTTAAKKMRFYSKEEVEEIMRRVGA